MKYLILITILLISACGGDSSSGSGSQDIGAGGSTGQSGSLATFTIAKGNLYVMDTSSVIAFSLTEPTDPQQFDKHSIELKDGETLFNHGGDVLLIGKNTGVDILGLTDAGVMNYLAEHSHITACDPVIAQGNRSFVTTRSGNNCGTAQSLLEVLDITDLSNPRVIYSQQMSAPHGLAVQADNLFICDLEEGLKRFTIFDTEDEFYLEPAYVSDVFACNDIILNGEHIILSHDDGLTQIHWQGDNFTRLSQMDVEH